jgi:hypothetical protein
MDEIFQYGWTGVRKFVKENRVALLYTLIVHLVVLIIFIFVKVEGLKNGQELGIQLEFEEKTLEQMLAEEELDVPADWLEEIMRQRELSSNRAVNVNAENKLGEEISTSEYVNDLLDQIEEARNQEDREKLEELQAILASADYVPPSSEDEDEAAVYAGPTTITFEFMEEPVNRGKVELTVPVYRCQGSGVVKVEVLVAPDGSVREARVLEPITGTDRVCFAEAALSAAQTSRFRIELSAAAKHRAIISYTFIAQ